jgi:hypothetical protein
MIEDDEKDAGTTDAGASTTDAPAGNASTTTAEPAPDEPIQTRDASADDADHPTALSQTEQPGITGTAFTGATAPPSDTVIGDPEGIVTNRNDLQGTIQREPKPEALPADAKITPLAEQVNPRAAQSVGTLQQPETVAGVDQPAEGLKNVEPDMSDASALLPEDSKQGDAAEVANADAERFADRGEKH